MKKLLKKIAITLLSSLITIGVVYGGFTMYAQDLVELPTIQLTFNNAINNYHGGMNGYFNGKMSELNVLLDDETFYTDKEKRKLLLPPEDKVCNSDNLSTYCVSAGALAQYIDYVKLLNTLKDTLATEYGASSIDSILEYTARRNIGIEAEIESAKDVLYSAVSVYNEYRLAYPMHKKYKKIIEDLTKYKLLLKDIRHQVVKFPVKFVDASTSQCE